MNEALDGVLAPPLENGEAVFEAPWQGRVFGMAQALAAAGVFSWDDFRARLIVELAGRAPDGDGAFEYYAHFQRALERTLRELDVIPGGLLAARAAVLAARAADHDHAGHAHPHSHPHDHDHDHDHT